MNILDRVESFLSSGDEDKIDQAIGVCLHVFEAKHDVESLYFAELIWPDCFNDFEVNEDVVKAILNLIKSLLETEVGHKLRANIYGILGVSGDVGLIEYLRDKLGEELNQIEIDADCVHQLLVSLDRLGQNVFLEYGGGSILNFDENIEIAKKYLKSI